KGQPGGLRSDVIQANIERTIRINRDVVPPSVIGTKFLPVFFSKEWISTEKEWLQCCGSNRASHVSAPTGKTHRAALDSFISLHCDYKEVERGLAAGPHLGI